MEDLEHPQVSSSPDDKVEEGLLEPQFTPFMDEIIDANQLERIPILEADIPPSEQQWLDTTRSKHAIHEIAIVKSRIGFDEHEFRAKCQQVQAAMCQEFKRTCI